MPSSLRFRFQNRTSTECEDYTVDATGTDKMALDKRIKMYYKNIKVYPETFYTINANSDYYSRYNDISKHFDKFLVRDELMKCYLLFDSVNSFLEFRAAIPQKYWQFHEVIHGKRPQRIRFDIDAKNSAHPNAGDKGISVRGFYNMIVDIIHETIHYVDDTYNKTISFGDFIVTTQIDETVDVPEKLSAHIILGEPIFLEDSEEAKVFHTNVLNSFAGIYDDYVDAGIYKSLQNFRLMGSNKNGVRPKVPYMQSKFDVPFGESLIGCYYPKDSVEFFQRKTQKKEEIKENERVGPIGKAIAAVVAKYTNYEFGSVADNGRTASFIRKTPDICPICERSHERERNLMAEVAEDRVKVSCWRRFADVKQGLCKHKWDIIEF